MKNKRIAVTYLRQKVEAAGHVFDEDRAVISKDGQLSRMDYKVGDKTFNVVWTND